jgi:ABC-type branched-subunit amino acid transport system substrate-binding protein
MVIFSISAMMPVLGRTCPSPFFRKAFMHTMRSPAAPSPIRPSRRRLLASTLTLPWLGLASAQAQEKTPDKAPETSIKIYQSTALTGPLGDLGSAMHYGATAAFSAVNERGGVHGRKIELSTLDDGYEVARAKANIEKMMLEPDCFALFNCMGTAMIAAVLPQVLETGVPLFAPFTGAQLARIKGARNVFNIRASYADEADKIVRHLSTLGIARIGLVYQNNTFGQDVLAGVQEAMALLKIAPVVTTTVKDDSSDALAAAQKIASIECEAVIVGLAGQPALNFVKAFRPLRRGVSVYGLSVLGTSANVKALGADATGLAIAQVMPLPTNLVVPVVRDFHQAWKTQGSTTPPSHLALEGYINARVFIEALQRAGKEPTRASFIDATWNLKKINLGGFQINTSGTERSASNFVELTMIGRDGRFFR